VFRSCRSCGSVAQPFSLLLLFFLFSFSSSSFHLFLSRHDPLYHSQDFSVFQAIMECVIPARSLKRKFLLVPFFSEFFSNLLLFCQPSPRPSPVWPRSARRLPLRPQSPRFGFPFSSVVFCAEKSHDSGAILAHFQFCGRGEDCLCQVSGPPWVL